MALGATPGEGRKPAGDHRPNVEHRLPNVVVFVHGAAAAAVVLLVLSLVAVE